MHNVTSRHRQIANFVQGHATVGRVWPGKNLAFEAVYLTPIYNASLPSAEQLADQFLSDTEFRALQLGDFFNTPTGEFLAEAVKLVIPDWLEPEFGLIVAALQLAATRQQVDSRARVGKGAVLMAGISLVAWALVKGNQ